LLACVSALPAACMCEAREGRGASHQGVWSGAADWSSTRERPGTPARRRSIRVLTQLEGCWIGPFTGWVRTATGRRGHNVLNSAQWLPHLCPKVVWAMPGRGGLTSLDHFGGYIKVLMGIGEW
jgi:hypothetical protein